MWGGHTAHTQIGRRTHEAPPLERTHTNTNKHIAHVIPRAKALTPQPRHNPHVPTLYLVVGGFVAPRAVGAQCGSFWRRAVWPQVQDWSPFPGHRHVPLPSCPRR